MDPTEFGDRRGGGVHILYIDIVLSDIFILFLFFFTKEINNMTIYKYISDSTISKRSSVFRRGSGFRFIFLGGGGVFCFPDPLDPLATYT